MFYLNNNHDTDVKCLKFPSYNKTVLSKHEISRINCVCVIYLEFLVKKFMLIFVYLQKNSFVVDFFWHKL